MPLGSSIRTGLIVSCFINNFSSPRVKKGHKMLVCSLVRPGIATQYFLKLMGGSRTQAAPSWSRQHGLPHSQLLFPDHYQRDHRSAPSSSTSSSLSSGAPSRWIASHLETVGFIMTELSIMLARRLVVACIFSRHGKRRGSFNLIFSIHHKMFMIFVLDALC